MSQIQLVYWVFIGSMGTCGVAVLWAFLRGAR